MANEPTSPFADLWADWEHPTHCSTCGRELVEVVEPDGFDSTTGERAFTTWLQCPKFPRNPLSAMFSRMHDSHSKNNPLIGKVWR